MMMMMMMMVKDFNIISLEIFVWYIFFGYGVWYVA